MNTKTELQQAMEKRNRNRIQKERIVEEESKKSPFQKMLEERAKRLEMLVRPQFSHVVSQTCRREALKMLLCSFSRRLRLKKEAIQVRIVDIAVPSPRVNFSRCMPN